MKQHCQCGCGCDSAATGADDNGVAVCDECAVMMFGPDGIVCGRLTHGWTQCHECGDALDWGGIVTGRPGEQNHCEARCSCGEWRNNERGGTWEGYSYTPRTADEVQS